MKKYIYGLLISALLLGGYFGPKLVHAGVSCSLPFNLTNGSTADATQVMANYNALVTCLGNAASAGVNTDITALTGLTTPITPGEGGTPVFIGGTSTGSANVQVVASTTPVGFTLTTNYQVVFIAGFGNTGSMTLNVNSTGAKAVYHNTPTGIEALSGGEIAIGNVVEATYDGTEYVLKNVSNQLGGAGATTTVVSASTTDLATAVNHNAVITGTTTITSFGSNATTNYPVYRMLFTGSLQLTYNASTLILPGAGNITTQTNDTAVAAYLGGGAWQVISYQPANGSSVVTSTPLCGFRALVIANNAGTPNTNIDVTAGNALMLNTTGVPITRSAVSFTINTTTGTVTSTANGMDGESRPTSAWVYLWMIDNGSGAAGLGSTSATAPTLPSGYTYKCLMGAMPTDGSANIFHVTTKGSWAQYIIGTNPAVTPNLGNGVTGTYSTTSPTLATASVTTYVPTAIATEIRLLAACRYGAGTGSGVQVAPNTSWGGANNGPAGSNGNVYPYDNNNSCSLNGASFVMMLESTTVAWAANATGGGLSVLGWKNAVNAN